MNKLAFALSLVALSAISAYAAPAVNVALSPVDGGAYGGTAVFGFNNTGNSSVMGTLYDHAGSSTSLNDGQTTTGGTDDTFGQSNTPSLSFIGATFTPSANLAVTKVVFYGANFGDGGWFGKNATNPDGSNAPPYGDGIFTLGASGLIAPQVQYTTNGGVSWVNVASTNDYVTQFTGLSVGGGAPTPAATFNLTGGVPANADGFRLIGTSGGYASGGGGFLGAHEIELFAVEVPEPSTWALLVGGLAVLGLSIRRKRSI